MQGAVVGVVAREVLEDITQRHESWGTASWPSQGDAEAFRAVTKGFARYANTSKDGVSARPSKGDLCESVPKEVAVPTDDKDKVPLTRYSQECRTY